MTGKESLQFDEATFSSEESKELYLFQWLSSAEKALLALHTDDIKSEQSSFEELVIKIITAASPFPAPGRPIRNAAARALVQLYLKGDTRTLYDALQTFLRVSGDAKAQDSDMAKVSSLYCIGELMSNLSSQVASFVTDIAWLTTKIAKSSSNPLILRYQALLTLRKSIAAAAKAATENAMKEVLKQGRNLLSDKAMCIQAAASELLTVLYPAQDPHRSPSDIENLVQLSVKALDSADKPTRAKLAAFVGHILASSQTERASSPPEPSKKSAKGKDKEKDEDDDIAPSPPALHDSPKTIMTVSEMFGVLSTHFNRPSTSRKTRVGLFECYAALLSVLGPSFVENNYAIIVEHLAENIIAHPFPRNLGSRYDVLFVRQGVSVLLRDVIAIRMLSEQGQIGAVRELSGSYLKNWPALMPNDKAPNKEVLVVTLREVSGLVAQMGNAPPPVQDALVQPLVQLLSHPSHSVRVASAWALRSFCYSTPLRLPKLILNVLELLQKDIAALPNPSAPVDISTRSLGHAYGLAALFAVIPERPLYVSYDLSAKVLDIATQLLKRASDHDLKIADVEVEVAWTCVASLMVLGPNFVKAHLPQLLVLWRNALPKPTSKDTALNTGRGVLEWMFLLHVRECALGAIFAFLKHNSPTLVTLDVTRRLSSLLSNAVGFANTFISQQSSLELPENMMHVGGKGITPIIREASLRRRAYQCFSMLGFNTLTESTQTTLLQSTVSLFASSEGYAGSTMQAAIASSSGVLPDVWQAADGYGYGVTSLTSGSIHGEDALGLNLAQLNWDVIDTAFEHLTSTPVLPSCEHDPLVLCDLSYSNSLQTWPEAIPATTAVVDASIELFSQLLLQQDSTSMMKQISQLVESVRSQKLEKNVGRKAAVFVNSTVALLKVLCVAMSGGTKQARDILGSSQIASAIAGFLKDSIADHDIVLRLTGSEAIGRLASLTGTSFLTSQVKMLVDTVVNNRDPSSRAGCALTFGAIHSYVGGLTVGPLLKTTINILMSLSNDPHPTVHYWSFMALSKVVNAASLSYSPFISATLGMLFNAYSLITHEEGGGILSNANLRCTLPTHQAICQIIDGIIAVMGPELQESIRTRSLILDLVHEFALETDEGSRVEAIKSVQHFLLFASDHVDMNELVGQLRIHLSSSCRPLKLASINALYQLVQKDALTMSKMGGDELVEDLFRMLDEDATVDGVKNIIISWLQQTAGLNPSAWLDLCQRIMSRTTALQTVASGPVVPVGLHDDEGESLGLDLTTEQGSNTGGLTSRWRTQLFALQCLHNICTIVARSERREHIDLVFARSHKIPTAHLLISRVTDLIKMAFTASAAYVMEIRLEGLVLLRDVIETFASAPDPDYTDAPLLEQHQAPITAALTPAFSSDSTPEILASAIQVCGVFVGSGIVKEITRMGRILKLLTSALEQSKDTGMLTIGEAKQLSPNASVMLRIATATAWAELEIASYQRSYLIDVVRPHKQMLSSLWVASLRDYASIRGDSEMLQDNTSAPIDSSYLALGREVLLPYYNQAWIPILKAVAISMASQEPTMLAALDGGESTSNHTNHNQIADLSRPRTLFFVLFGLVYETLANSSTDATSTPTSRENAVVALQAMKSLVQPQFCGQAILDPTIFEEFASLCYRMAMTETAMVQTSLVEVIASLAASQSGSIRHGPQTNELDGKLPPDSPLTHCLRICAFVLRQNIPSARTPFIQSEGNSPKDRLALLSAAFSACSTVGRALGQSYKEDVRAVGVALYSDILKDESCDWDIAGPTLPSLKAMLEYNYEPSSPPPDSKYAKLIHGLLSSCLSNIDEMRGRQGTISTLKIKNNLLASVVILTIVPTKLSLSRDVVEYCCSLISQKLFDDGEIALTAAHCCKTLMMAATSSNCNVILKHCAQTLIPGMIRFIATVAGDSDDAAAQDTGHTFQAVDEVLKAFNGFFAGVAEEHRARVLGILIPTSMLLLSDGTPLKLASTYWHKVGIDNLLSLAATAPQAFREATGKLNVKRRTLLENSIREAVTDKSSSTSKSTKPTIALRSF